jgi:hypothetical protein
LVCDSIPKVGQTAKKDAIEYVLKTPQNDLEMRIAGGIRRTRARLEQHRLEPEKDQEHKSEQEQDEDGDVDQSGSSTLPFSSKVPGGYW